MGVGSPWYPDVDPADLRRAAQAYRDLGSAVTDAAEAASPSMLAFFAANKSKMIGPYQDAWTALADARSCPGGYMGQLRNGCSQMAAGLEEAARGIEDLRDKIDEMVAAGAVVTVAAGLVSFGLGSAVATAATAGTVATTTTVAISMFLTRVAIVAVFEFVGGYLTDLSLQAMSQSVFEPGRPIDVDHGDAFKMGGVGAAIGGPLYAVPGAYRLTSNIRYASSMKSLPRMGFFGKVGEARALRMLEGLGETSPILQRQVRRPNGTRPSTADIIVRNPGPALRAQYSNPSSPWSLALIEAKTTGRSVPASALLRPNQTATLVRMARDGGRASAPLQALLGLPSSAIAPGTTSHLLVVVAGQGDILARMPVRLRHLVTTHGWEVVVSGAAGGSGQRMALRFLDQLPVRVVEVL